MAGHTAGDPLECYSVGVFSDLKTFYCLSLVKSTSDIVHSNDWLHCFARFCKYFIKSVYLYESRLGSNKHSNFFFNPL